jgi:hypothetical protein
MKIGKIKVVALVTLVLGTPLRVHAQDRSGLTRTDNNVVMRNLAAAVVEYRLKNGAFPVGDNPAVILQLCSRNLGVAYLPKPLNDSGELIATNGLSFVIISGSTNGWWLVCSVSSDGRSFDECIVVSPDLRISELYNPVGQAIGGGEPNGAGNMSGS